MTQSDRIAQVTAAYGQAEQFWDIYFTPLQRSYAEAGEMRSISVSVDPTDGEVSLNAGYAEGSPENNCENSLFENFMPSIVATLVKEVPSDDPTYRAFLETATADKESCEELFQILVEQLAEHEVDYDQN